MTSTDRILASGNLASSRRTVTGVLGQLALAGLDDQERLTLLQQIGLPKSAIDDPEFPISMGQELQALGLMLPGLEARSNSVTGFAIETFSQIGVNHYGVLGLAMQHAPTLLDALTFFLDHPESSWGHSRIVIRDTGKVLHLDFDMDRPAGGDLLQAYCVTRDLVSVYRLIRDLVGPMPAPITLELPFEGVDSPLEETPWERTRPRSSRNAWIHRARFADQSAPTETHERFAAASFAAPVSTFDGHHVLPCPVTFGAPTASLTYPRTLLHSTPIHASPTVFKRYAILTQQSARVLADDASLTEQTTRLLWAYTPPPDREQVATMLTMSARSLARKLAAEGTTFNTLLQRVQQERACNLLGHTKLSVAVIADRLGYSEAAAFTRAFQAWTGTTPSHWRRGHRELR